MAIKAMQKDVKRVGVFHLGKGRKTDKKERKPRVGRVFKGREEVFLVLKKGRERTYGFGLLFIVSGVPGHLRMLICLLP